MLIADEVGSQTVYMSRGAESLLYWTILQTSSYFGTLSIICRIHKSH